jgi:hypothetical protein
MRNQWSNLVVAPRAGFEPATNRLTEVYIALGCRAVAMGCGVFMPA